MPVKEIFKFYFNQVLKFFEMRGFEYFQKDFNNFLFLFQMVCVKVLSNAFLRIFLSKKTLSIWKVLLFNFFVSVF